jgi:hypothetical protein
VDVQENLDPDNGKLEFNTVPNAYNNQFDHQSLDKVVRLLNADSICHSVDNCVPGHNYLIPDLPRILFQAHQIRAIWDILRRSVWHTDMPGAWVADERLRARLSHWWRQ